MFPGQTSPFAAQVEFFQPDQIRDILASLLARYYRASTNEAKTEADPDILQQMVVWAPEVIKNCQDENGRVYFERSQTATLLNDLQPFTHQAVGENEGVAALW